MKKFDSVLHAVRLANVLGIEEMPFAGRSDNWWGMFWDYINIEESTRIKEHYEKQA